MEAYELVKLKPNENIDRFTPGDTVQVGVRVTEANRTRTQVFEGVVIRVRGGGPSTSFTVRRVSYDVGVERTFMMHSQKTWSTSSSLDVVGSGERAFTIFEAGPVAPPVSRKTGGSAPANSRLRKTVPP